MDSLTLDHIRIFLAVVDEGSFSTAAKKLNRTQSAVTYGVQNAVGRPAIKADDGDCDVREPAIVERIYS
jgi:hypothetical protein